MVGSLRGYLFSFSSFIQYVFFVLGVRVRVRVTEPPTIIPIHIKLIFLAYPVHNG